jgi:hypothetical protein
MLAALPVWAADEKKPEKKEKPTIALATPFAVAAGQSNMIVVRGSLLTNATAVHFTDRAGIHAQILSREKAKVPEKADAKKAGDTQLEVAVTVPADAKPGEVTFYVSTPEGDANTNRLYVVRGDLHVEKEPNGAFRKCNSLKIGSTVRGAIQDAADVDVFQFRGEAGQTIRVTGRAAPFGSTVDLLLSLHVARGHVLKTADDVAATDASFTAVLPAAGEYFVTVTDAHERGGPLYDYVLELETPASK